MSDDILENDELKFAGGTAFPSVGKFVILTIVTIAVVLRWGTPSAHKILIVSAPIVIFLLFAQFKIIFRRNLHGFLQGLSIFGLIIYRKKIELGNHTELVMLSGQMSTSVRANWFQETTQKDVHYKICFVDAMHIKKLIAFQTKNKDLAYKGIKMISEFLDIPIKKYNPKTSRSGTARTRQKR